jgi:hypothetical protein
MKLGIDNTAMAGVAELSVPQPHIARLSPARISPRSLAGVTGMASIFTPNGRSASSVAAQTAGGAPMRPPSPPPLIPYSVYGDGVST